MDKEEPCLKIKKDSFLMINKDSEEKNKTPDDDIELACEEHIKIRDVDTDEIILNKRG